MIGTTRQVTAFAYGAPCDMRKQFDSLSALVTLQMKHELLSGHLFLFVARNRHRAKVLYWDGTGLCLFAKRLEQGRFACLWSDPPHAPLRLTMSELTLFLEGSKLVGKVAMSPAEFLLPR